MHLRPHRALRVSIERREGLVEQEHIGIACECACERDALALTARQLVRAGVREVRDPEALEVFVDPLTARVRDVLPDGQVGEEGVLLEDEPDPPVLRRTRHPALDVEPDLLPERHAPRGRTDEARDRAQYRRLARARRPDQGDRALDGES